MPNEHLELFPKILCHIIWVSAEAATCCWEQALETRAGFHQSWKGSKQGCNAM